MEHDFSIDRRLRIIKDAIIPFQKEIDNIINECIDNDKRLWESKYALDMEEQIGSVFIILQNYINATISELFPELKKLQTKYLLDKKISNSNITRIQLIIAIANHYKNRGLPERLKIQTENVLDHLEIGVKTDFEDDKFNNKFNANSSILLGFSLLSESWNINDLIIIISEWRNKLLQNKILCKQQ